ncbi:MAG: ABC-type multidrug transport system fused ATPase/permease subunit [Bacteriovoracaceae bacterium]|jgi:ABC-type multidrug transport system fused ATPase/permease subunit
MSEKKKKASFLHADEQDESVIDKHRIGDLAAFLSLFKFAKGHYLKISIGLGLIFIGAATAIVSARLTGFLVDDGLKARNMDMAVKFASYIILCEIVPIFLAWQGRKLISFSTSKTIFNIRTKLFDHLQKLPLSFYDRQPQGRIVTRVTHDVEGVEQFFSNSLGRLIQSAATAGIAMMAMMLTYPKLGGILIASMLPAILFIFFTRELVRRTNRKMSSKSSQCNSKLSEYLNGMEVIRAFGMEKWANQKYADAVNEHEKSQLAANQLFSWSRPLISFLCTLPLVGLVWFGGNALIGGSITVGIFVAYIRYCERFFMPIMTLAREIHVIQQAFTSAERVATFINHETEVKELGNDGDFRGKPGSIAGKVEFKEVGMYYNPDQWVLEDLSFDIKAGEKIGLVGTTGCGKTTTVSLLSRLYEFQKGEILLDSRSIRGYERNFLREQIGFVSQDVIIFRGSLKQNLTTDESLSDEVIIECCKNTGLYQVMKDTGIHLKSEILEGGSNLSIGERQLVALTRVLVRNPSILVLDEATANIDPGYEEIIHNAVEKAMDGRTCLIIAHRLDTLKSCDQIFVFDKGRLVEKGAEADLQAQKGHFYRLQNADQTHQV